MDKVILGKKLAALRKQYNYTQRGVAEQIQLKEKTYQAYEEGRATPSIFTLIILQQLYFFVTVNDMLGLIEEEQV